MNREAIRKSLIEQLKKRGADIDCFVDLIQKYLDFWDVDAKLTADINNRGVMFVDKSAAGVDMMKNNPSVKEKVVVNRQMLSILQQLNITTESISEGDDVFAPL